MQLPQFIVRRLFKFAMRVANTRYPDVVIGQRYLRRWWLIPHTRFFNIYLHHFVGSDDDRALHDHPWFNVSCILHGGYYEHTITAGGIHHRKLYGPGNLKARLGSYAHRVELAGDECWTLFITGPKYRSWGFHCPFSGWTPWAQFEANAGCGETD